MCPTTKSKDFIFQTKGEPKMSKMHEILAVEETVTQASEKLLAETQDKFGKISEQFTGSIRTLERLNDSPEDKAIESTARQVKELPTNVVDTVAYILPYLKKALDLKLSKHLTNQIAKADIVVDGTVLMIDVPVDFLLDLEKQVPRWRKLFASMPTLDPSREWTQERVGVWKTKEPIVSAQTEKVMFPVIMHEATVQHPAQVKESTKDVVVGTFKQTLFSGAATTQQKADAIALCDKLIVAVKEARMRANTVEVATPKTNSRVILDLFAKVFE
jgi:hypothetical protein